MMKRHILILLSAIFSTTVLGQQNNIRYEVEAQAIGTTNNVVPFWMRSNQFGSIPSQGASGSFIGRAYKEYDEANTRLLDWGAGFQGRVNAGKNSNLKLIEGFVKVKAGVFQLKAGRTKNVMGLNGDTSLTSGNWSVSGNALGIPQIELSIPNYYRLPLVDGLISFKGNFVHGWTGKQDIRNQLIINGDTIRNHPPVGTYFHQKSLYVKIGKLDWKLALIGGFNHQAYWGSEKKLYGKAYDISNFQNFLYLVTGTTFNNNKVPGSKVGNHLGSLDLGFEYEFDKVRLKGYRQFFYDAGALGHLANIKDGLTGVTVINKKDSEKSFFWDRFLLEFLYTKNQAGELNSKKTPSGDEDYYNNFNYWKGWSYFGQNLGTPFLTSRDDVKAGLVNDPTDYFINNRVVALHIGSIVRLNRWRYTTKLSFSRNYGTYKTSNIGNSAGSKRQPPRYGIFNTVNQFSGYFDAMREISNGINVGYSISIDQGKLLPNSMGGLLKLSKSF